MNNIIFNNYFYYLLTSVKKEKEDRSINKSNDNNSDDNKLYEKLIYENEICEDKTDEKKQGEVEVYKIYPEYGKFYLTTTYTRKTGTYYNSNERYYSTNPLRYVGKYIKTIHSSGYYDNLVYAIFINNKNNNNEEKLEYTYEGTTCFIEINPDFSPS